MGEKFNSGRGGYICDNCRKLLWAGMRGSLFPKNRQFLYSTQQQDIVETNQAFDVPGNYRAYCSESCAIADKENY